MWNKEAEYQICWHFSEWRQCGFSSSAYGETNVPINIRTAGVETRIGFSYSVTQQPDVVTWQHSSLKPVSSYCKTKYGRTTRRKAASTESDGRRFASNDESRAAVDINLLLKLFIQFGPNLTFLPRKNLCLETTGVEPPTGSGPKKKTWKKKVRPNMVRGCSTLERHKKCVQICRLKTWMEEITTKGYIRVECYRRILVGCGSNSFRGGKLLWMRLWTVESYIKWGMWEFWRRGEAMHGFGGETWGRQSLGRPRRRWEDNIKVDLQEVGWGGMDCWRVVNAVMKLRVP